VVLHTLNELPFPFGWRIPSARCRFFVRPVHSITALPFLVRPAHPSPGLRLFVWPAHLIAAPHSLCSAGASHRRATISSFAGAFAADPPIWCCFVCRRIRRRSTNLVLLRLPAHSPPIHQFGVALFAGAFAADPPIWCCFVCRRIPRRAATNLALLHLAGAFPAALVSSFAGAFAANPPIW
jgi:hypothetical protein